MLILLELPILTDHFSEWKSGAKISDLFLITKFFENFFQKTLSENLCAYPLFLSGKAVQKYDKIFKLPNFWRTFFEKI
jgi:hypothetical protein